MLFFLNFLGKSPWFIAIALRIDLTTSSIAKRTAASQFFGYLKESYSTTYFLGGYTAMKLLL